MTLRGAGVEVDARRAGRVALAVGLVALAVLAVVFFVVGADKNAQITQLRGDGVRVEIRVSRCLALLGGSGSNGAGYACRGTYTVDGRRYLEAIPGDSLLAPGTTVRGVAAREDPALVSTVAVLADEHPSWRVFILPTVLSVVLVVLLGALALRRRSGRSAG